MLRTQLFVILLSFMFVACDYTDPASQQLPMFRDRTKRPEVLTISNGAPVGYNESRVSLNKPLIFNEYLMDTLTHISRERIPDRLIHGKGAGAHGEFIVTNDISHICKAKFLSKVGKITPVAVRFSLVIASVGSPDTLRDSRGFAIKFYTEEGNLDLLTVSVPVFPIKDPINFPSFIHSMKRNPVTNLIDPNMIWDFNVHRPESLHSFMYVMGDAGIPYTYRHMSGYGVHTYEVVNELGDYTFLRFHIKPNAGVEDMVSESAKKIAGEDPDFHTRDLYNAIAKGNYPSWNISAQILTLDQVENADFDVFDTTKSLPLDKYPLTSIGMLILNKNVNNFFAEMEQLAFSPGNLVPGILGSPDKLFEARRLVYRDTQYHRLGVNFRRIPVNCPFHAATYNRKGLPPVHDNGGDGPNYYPNSFNGPISADYEINPPLMMFYQNDTDNYEQAAEVYRNMSEGKKKRFIKNVIDSLKGVDRTLIEKALSLFSHVSLDLVSRLTEGLS